HITMVRALTIRRPNSIKRVAVMNIVDRPWRWLSNGILILVACVAVLPTAQAQEQSAKPQAPIRVGYTRPGNPSDTEKNGKLFPLAWDPTYKKALIGGTVYFAVYERTGTEGDLWGTGIKDFDKTFVEGRSFKNEFSPGLDTQAKYLYLYMVVN